MYLGVVDTQTLDFVKRKQNPDKEHLVFLLQREGKAIDDAEGQQEKECYSTVCVRVRVWVRVSVLPPQDLQQLCDAVVMFSLIDESVW